MGQSETKKGFFVFFDEIQYLKNWEIHLKSLADSYLHVKFVASGSAAAALKMKSQESGAGRFSEFKLPPLTFNEYIHLKNLNRLIFPSKIIWNDQTIPVYETIDIHQLNDHFLDYINYGGYPEVVFSKTIRTNPQQFIKNDIVDKVMLKDLPSLYGITDVQELNSLFSVIAYHSGNEFSYEKLSGTSGIKKDVIRKYIEYLEAAFLIKVIHKTDINAKQFQRATQFKIYLTNPSLRSALFSTLRATDMEMGDMVETAVFSQWIQRENSGICYASWKQGRHAGEVEIVGVNPSTFKPQWAVEVKWSDRYFGKPRDLTSLLQFMKSNHMNQAIVTTISKSGTAEIDSMHLLFIPAAVYTFLVGKNTIDRKQQSLGL
jgi:predicted AAA+ superfamily ATPase